MQTTGYRSCNITQVVFYTFIRPHWIESQIDNKLEKVCHKKFYLNNSAQVVFKLKNTSQARRFWLKGKPRSQVIKV